MYFLEILKSILETVRPKSFYDILTLTQLTITISLLYLFALSQIKMVNFDINCLLKDLNLAIKDIPLSPNWRCVELQIYENYSIDIKNKDCVKQLKFKLEKSLKKLNNHKIYYGLKIFLFNKFSYNKVDVCGYSYSFNCVKLN